jgi:hypothetical protein
MCNKSVKKFEDADSVMNYIHLLMLDVNEWCDVLKPFKAGGSNSKK